MDKKLINEEIFDKNFHDEDFDNCKCCGNIFDSYDIMYKLYNVYDGSNFYFCEDCKNNLKKELI